MAVTGLLAEAYDRQFRHPVTSTHEQRIQNELAYQSVQADKERESIKRTPDALVEQYRTCRNWRTHRVECVIRLLTMHQPQHICDFGCGSGEMACRLGRMGYRVTGLDVSPELIDLARERAKLDGVEDRVSFIVADGASATLPKNEFDAVLAMSVIHHLPLEAGLDTLEGLLKPGGRIAFQEPVAFLKGLQWLRDRTPVEKDVSPDERQLSMKEIQRIHERFEVEEMHYYHLLTRLSRLMSYKQALATAPLLRWIDSALLIIPGVHKFSGAVVILGRKRG